MNNPFNRNRNGSDKSNVVSFDNVVHFNFAIAIFAVIIIYVLISALISMNKKPVTTYKVVSSNINNNITCTGIAIRNESIVESTKSGYTCYYIRDGEKVRKGSAVCTVDETGNIVNSLQLMSNQEAGSNIFNTTDYVEIRDTISVFKISYSDEDFFDVYNLGSNVENKVLEKSNEILMEQLQESTDSIKNSVENVSSPASGIVTYYIDGFEEKKPETLDASDFDKSNYTKKSLKTNGVISSGTNIFKIIEDENWNIVCKVDYDQANLLIEEGRVQFTINNSDYVIVAPLDLIQKDDYYLVNISLKKYMTDYINDRFLNIEIILDKYDGLKIPNSALTTKEVLKVPIDFLSSGSNDSISNKVNIKYLNENDEITIKQIDLNIYKTEDGFAYVDPLNIGDSQVIIQLDTNKELLIESLSKDTLVGVYFANKGIADFMEVAIVKSGDEFTIVSDGGRLKEFDNIVMNSNDVYENQIIY